MLAKEVRAKRLADTSTATPAPAGSEDIALPQALPASQAVPKREEGTAVLQRAQGLEPSAEEVGQLLACLRNAAPGENDWLRHELTALLQQHAGKRAKMDMSGGCSSGQQELQEAEKDAHLAVQWQRLARGRGNEQAAGEPDLQAPCGLRSGGQAGRRCYGSGQEGRRPQRLGVQPGVGGGHQGRRR